MLQTFIKELELKKINFFSISIERDENLNWAKFQDNHEMVLTRSLERIYFSILDKKTSFKEMIVHSIEVEEYISTINPQKHQLFLVQDQTQLGFVFVLKEDIDKGLPKKSFWKNFIEGFYQEPSGLQSSLLFFGKEFKSGETIIRPLSFRTSWEI